MVTREDQMREAAGLVLAIAEEMGEGWSVTTVDGQPVMVGPNREHIRGRVGWYGTSRKRLTLEGLWPSMLDGEVVWAAQGFSVSLGVVLDQERTARSVARGMNRTLLPRYTPTLEERLAVTDENVKRWRQAKRLREEIAEIVQPVGATRIEPTRVVSYNPAKSRPSVAFDVVFARTTVDAEVKGLSPSQARALAEFLTTL